MTCTALRIQAILYNPDLAAVERSIASIAANAEAWHRESSEAPRIVLALGDASPTRTVSDDDVSRLASLAGSNVALTYRFFGENTGYGKGHDLLAEGADEDLLLFINPDIVFAPHCIERLVKTAGADPSIGIVEARQTPNENAKRFDATTGETDWACGACLLARRAAFEKAGGFDWRTFFMYCEDVDVSWAVRHAGYRIVYQPAAIAFHPHRLSSRGLWEPSTTEQYHDTLGKLLLASKWGDHDQVRRMLAAFTWDDNPLKRRAAQDFRALAKERRAPAPVKNGAAAATFRGIDHTTYRHVPPSAVPIQPEPWTADHVLAGKECDLQSDQSATAPFLSVIVPTTNAHREELAETLTCLAAQTVDDFEVLLAAASENARTIASDLLALIPEWLQHRTRIVPGAARYAETIVEACHHARGLYFSVLREGDIVFDQWAESFRAGAAQAPGSLVHCFATRQWWKRGAAPVTGDPALFCADAIDPAWCTPIDPADEEAAAMPIGSWAVPLFAAVDLNLVDKIEPFDQPSIARLCMTCGLIQVEQATILERRWTHEALLPDDAPAPTSALRRAVPVEAKAALRFVQRRISTKGPTA